MKTTPKPKAGAQRAPAHVKKAADIRRNVAQASALVKAAPVAALELSYQDAMIQAKDHIGKGLQMLTAAVAMRNLSTPQLAGVLEYATSTMDAVEEAKALARGRVLDVALKEGTVVSEKGSRRLDLGDGRYVPVTIQKSGTDPKLFEQGLRAKSKDVAKYMDTVLSYKLKDGTASQDMAIHDGVFTADEVATMAYKPSYRVDRVKEGSAHE